MSAIRAARAMAIGETMYRVEAQAASLRNRIAHAEAVGDGSEVVRLQGIADSCRESIGRYQSELHDLTAQAALNLEVLQ
jgi:hypothetical protein